MNPDGWLVAGAYARRPDDSNRASGRRRICHGYCLCGECSDKGYSLADCISMEFMRREANLGVLLNDEHFSQEGFLCLLRV